MNSQEEKNKKPRTLSTEGFVSPFLEGELFVVQSEAEWESRLAALRAESLFRCAFEQDSTISIGPMSAKENEALYEHASHIDEKVKVHEEKKPSKIFDDLLDIKSKPPDFVDGIYEWYVNWQPTTYLQIQELSTEKLIGSIGINNLLLSYILRNSTRLSDVVPNKYSLIQNENKALNKELARRIDSIDFYERRYSFEANTSRNQERINLLKQDYELLQKEYLKDKYIGRWRNQNWDWMTLKGIEDLGSSLIATSPTDMNEFCPDYPQFNRFKKRLFWIALISSMAKHESDFKTMTTYTESNGTISRGLLQISIGSVKQSRYMARRLKKKTIDEIKTANDLHDPEKNIRAGIRILNYWVESDKRIAGSIKQNGSWEHFGGARYWSVLRSNSVSSGNKLKDIKNWTKDITNWSKQITIL